MAHVENPAADPTEVEWLLHDVRLIHAACQRTSAEQVGDLPTLDHGRYVAIAGDLWQKLVNHCQAVGILLSAGLFDSALIVNRAVYEATINLIYLMTVGDKMANAQLFETRMVIDFAEIYSDRPPPLGAIPPDVLAGARRYKKDRKLWSGKTLTEMASVIGLVGHKTVYAVQSFIAHSRIGGLGIEKKVHPDDTVEWLYGGAANPRDVKAVANHTRRMLHKVYSVVTKDFYGMIPKLATTNPFESNREALRERLSEQKRPTTPPE